MREEMHPRGRVAGFATASLQGGEAGARGGFPPGFPPTLGLPEDLAGVEVAAAAALPRPEIVHEERSYCTYVIIRTRIRIRILADLGYRQPCA